MDKLKISDDAKDDADYASHAYAYTDIAKHFPSTVEVVTHMKLLKAIEVYKQKIIGNKGSDVYKTKVWSIFLSNAIRRFIILISALHKYYDISSKIPKGYGRNTPKYPSPDATNRPVKASETLIPAIKYYHGPNESQLVYAASENHQQWGKVFESWLPPLDILIVWHSFLLNPKSCYDNFVRLQFLQFSNYPFPMKLINQSIDSNFEYHPNKLLQENYLDIISRFTAESTDLVYTIPDFNISQPLVNIYCPICSSVLAYDYPWTTNENTGFGDKGFTYTLNNSVCKCPFSPIITHDELRKRQLYADVKSDKCLPGVFKNWSEVISSSSQSMNDPMNISLCIKTIIKQTISLDEDFQKSSLATFATGFRSKVYRLEIKLILRNYLQIGLIHLAVNHGMFISDDLLGCIIRQERFIEKINNSSWLFSPDLKPSIDESIVRYDRFLQLVIESNEMLVPTLDIDLVWHTHQLSQFFYFNHFDSKSGVIDHEDKVEAVVLDSNFKNTVKLYQSKFKSDYSKCICWYCVSAKGKSSSRSLFKKSTKKSTSNSNGDSITHTSIHPSIDLPTATSIEKREELEKQYSGKLPPWKQDECETLKGANGVSLINSPNSPIPSECSGLYYTQNGLCCIGPEAQTKTTTSARDFAMSLHGKAVQLGPDYYDADRMAHMISRCYAM